MIRRTAGVIIRQSIIKDNRTLAQLVERLPYTQNVVSSNLAGPTKYGTVAERPNAPDCKSVKPGVQIPPVPPY